MSFNPNKVADKPRDFTAEAHGKTRCQMWAAVIQSPVFAQMFYATSAKSEEILKEARKWADDGHDYTFGK